MSAGWPRWLPSEAAQFLPFETSSCSQAGPPVSLSLSLSLSISLSLSLSLCGVSERILDPI